MVHRRGEMALFRPAAGFFRDPWINLVILTTGHHALNQAMLSGLKEISGSDMPQARPA
jgi:hypothetical protein